MSAINDPSSSLSKNDGTKSFESQWPLPVAYKKIYSHLSNSRGGWNKRRGGAKVAKSINVEVGINVEGGIFL